jgi:hypothetical protein
VNSRYFLETIVTERLEKVSLFLRMYCNSKAVSFKEYYDYSPVSTSAEKTQYILRNDHDYKDVDL